MKLKNNSGLGKLQQWWYKIILISLRFSLLFFTYHQVPLSIHWCHNLYRILALNLSHNKQLHKLFRRYNNEKGFLKNDTLIRITMYHVQFPNVKNGSRSPVASMKKCKMVVTLNLKSTLFNVVWFYSLIPQFAKLIQAVIQCYLQRLDRYNRLNQGQ